MGADFTLRVPDWSMQTLDVGSLVSDQECRFLARCRIFSLSASGSYQGRPGSDQTVSALSRHGRLFSGSFTLWLAISCVFESLAAAE